MQEHIKQYEIDFEKVHSFLAFRNILTSLNSSIVFFATEKDFCNECGKYKEIKFFLKEK